MVVTVVAVTVATVWTLPCRQRELLKGREGKDEGLRSWKTQEVTSVEAVLRGALSQLCEVGGPSCWPSLLDD